MSRNIKNSGLAELCAAADLQVGDLACILQCHQESIRLCAAGRKPLPRIEAGLARVFNLSIPELRKTLFNRRRSHAAANRSINQPRISHALKAAREMASFHTVIWNWIKAPDLPAREWHCKNFESYAADPEIQMLIQNGRQHPKASIKIKRLPLNTLQAALFVN